MTDKSRRQGTRHRNHSADRQLHVAAHFGIEFEFNTHAGEISRRRVITSFSSLKAGIPKAASRQFPGDGRRRSLLRRCAQDIRARQTRRTCADNRHFFTVCFTPDISGRQPISNALSLNSAQCCRWSPHRTHRSGCRNFAQTVLRADTSANFRQGVCLCDSSAASKIRPSLASFSQFGCSCVPGISTRSMGCRTTGSVSLRFGLAFGKRLVNFNKLNLRTFSGFFGGSTRCRSIN